MDEQRNVIQIGTLGPSGTSSEAAAAYFIQTDEKNPKSYSITLLNSFQSVLQGLIHGELSMALVPHAYNDINLFYINPQVALYRMFQFDTPAYGLARRRDMVLSQHSCRVVSHPAPILLLDNLLAQIGLSVYEIGFVSSTSKAAEEVYENKADLALTNMNAINKYNLVCCALYGPIQMGWSVFIKKEFVV
jgi:bacilysin biosynthesis protein BacA